MMKKITSFMLSVLMIFALASVSVSAADAKDIKLTDAQAAQAVETAAGALVGADEDAEVEVSEDLADKIMDDANTPAEISRAIAQLVFVDIELVDEISDRIIADSKFTVKVLDDGKTTVYVAVELLDNPEIYDARVFLSVCNKIAEECDKRAIEKGVDIESDNYNPMDYYHIAGELALHMILADVTDALGGSDWNTSLKDYYERAIRAGLEVDENRVSVDFIRSIGQFITFFLSLLFG